MMRGRAGMPFAQPFSGPGTKNKNHKSATKRNKKDLENITKHNK